MKLKMSLALVAVASLTACVSAPPPQRVAVVQQPQGVEGEWLNQNGFVSTLSGGTFTTRTTDSNQVVASGTYTNLSPTLVEITSTSIIRKTTTRVNCSLAGTTQLNCTQQDGAQFSLARKG